MTHSKGSRDRRAKTRLLLSAPQTGFPPPSSYCGGPPNKQKKKCPPPGPKPPPQPPHPRTTPTPPPPPPPPKTPPSAVNPPLPATTSLLPLPPLPRPPPHPPSPPPPPPEPPPPLPPALPENPPPPPRSLLPAPPPPALLPPRPPPPKPAPRRPPPSPLRPTCLFDSETASPGLVRHRLRPNQYPQTSASPASHTLPLPRPTHHTHINALPPPGGPPPLFSTPDHPTLPPIFLSVKLPAPAFKFQSSPVSFPPPPPNLSFSPKVFPKRQAWCGSFVPLLESSAHGRFRNRGDWSVTGRQCGC